MPLVLLVLALVFGLLLVPFGLPGLWVMVAAALVYSYAVPSSGIGVASLLVAFAMALGAELMEFALAGRFARRYGGSRRAGWGAVLGGIVGAIVGVPVPLIGSMIGAFAGAFVGALLFELTLGTRAGPATRVATGALLGRVAAVVVKVALGVMMAVWLLFGAMH